MVNIPYYLQGRIDDSFRSLAARKQRFSCTGDVRVRVFFLESLFHDTNVS